MPRKRRDEEVVLSAYKRMIADKNCPYAHRIFCINALAVATGMFKMVLIMPGTPRFKFDRMKLGNPDATIDPVAEDEGDFLEELNKGGANVSIPDSN